MVNPYWSRNWHLSVKMGQYATNTMTIGVNPTGAFALRPRLLRRVSGKGSHGFLWLGIKVWWLPL